MKKYIIYLLSFLLIGIASNMRAQLVSKTENDGTLSEIKGDRKTDIEAFHINVGRLQSAYLNHNNKLLKISRSNLINLASVEIQRSKKNLYDLKTGKLTRNPNTNKAFNVKVEIQTLSNMLKREQYLFNRLSAFDPNIKVNNPRELSGIKSNLYEFEKWMKNGLKYEKMPKFTGHPQHSTGTLSIKNYHQSSGRVVLNTSHQLSAKPAKNNLPPSYFRRMENRQIKALNSMRTKNNKNATLLLNNFNAYINKGNFEKAKNMLLQFNAIVHSNIHTENKFLKRSMKFKYVKINQPNVRNIINKEQSIENQLNNIKISKTDDIKAVQNKITELINSFIKLTAIEVK